MNIRTTLLTAATGIALLLTAPANAGGPIIEDTESAPVVVERQRPNALLPILIGIGILAIIASGGGGSDDCQCNSPDDGGPSPCGC